MRWEAWTLVVSFVLEVLATVYVVGKPRGPMTSGSAVWAVITWSLWIWLVLRLART